MYSNIVVGVDGGSGGCDAAVLAALLSTNGARATLVHACVINPGTGSSFDPAFELADSEQTIALMKRERDLSGRPGDAMSVPTTSVGRGLEGVATERGSDLIVVGSCRRPAIGRVLLGDDAASVLHHARRPVAIAPAGFASQSRRLNRVGVAYDGTAESNVALDCAEALVEGVEAEVSARCVVAPHVYAFAVGAAPYREDPEDLRTRTRAEIGDLGSVRVEVAVGPTNPELAAFSEEVDVLVCGSAGKGPLQRIVLGSTSDYLAHHARCPLLVTPARARAGAVPA